MRNTLLKESYVAIKLHTYYYENAFLICAILYMGNNLDKRNPHIHLSLRSLICT